MNILELSKRMKELSGKATGGPWAEQGDAIDAGFVDCGSQVICQMWDKMEDDFPNAENNRKLIAASRTAIDQFVRFVEKVEALEKACGCPMCCSLAALLSE